MKKIILLVTLVLVTSLCACSKADDTQKIKEESIVADDTIARDVVTAPEENEPGLETVSEETPYLIKNFDTDEVIGYLQADDEIVKKVIEDATAFFKADCSAKPDTVEETLKTLRKNHQVSAEILTDDFIDETVKQYQQENIQEDFYSIEFHQLRFREDKNAVTVVATVSNLDTKMDLKINKTEAAFEYNSKYDIWTFVGTYSVEQIQ